jgi:DNA-directed RNA polymerase subunit N (RpoN/RPB10)
MIIPVSCFTCGKTIGDKYRYYQAEVAKRKMAENKNPDEIVYLTKNTVDKTIEALVMDSLGVKKVCCRRHFLTHVDIE